MENGRDGKQGNQGRAGILQNVPRGNEGGMGSAAAKGQGGNPRGNRGRDADVLTEVMQFLGTRIPICGKVRAKVEANIAFAIQIAQAEFRENHLGK